MICDLRCSQMKKYLLSIVLAFTIIFSCIGMVGCNNGFELVKSISITTNGEVKKFSSSSTPYVSLINDKYISAEEFNNAPEDRKYINGIKLNELSKITIDEAIKAAKNSTHYEIVEKELEGYWYSKNSYTPNGNIYYHRYEYENTYCNFVYVKVKNDTTIVIKSGSTETTYTVTSYSIVKF